MMKMLIRLDEEKIAREEKYDINETKAYLNAIFKKRNMTLDDDDWYTDGDFTACGALIIKLSKKKWFMDNVLEWLWYDTEDQSLEDLKAHYAELSKSDR